MTGKRRQLAEGRPRLAQQAIHRQTQRQGSERQAFEQPQQSQPTRPHSSASTTAPASTDHSSGLPPISHASRPTTTALTVGIQIFSGQTLATTSGAALAAAGSPAAADTAAGPPAGNHAGRAHRPQPRPAAGRRERGGQNRFEHQQQQALQRQPRHPAGYHRQRQQQQPLTDNQLAQLRRPAPSVLSMATRS